MKPLLALVVATVAFAASAQRNTPTPPSTYRAPASCDRQPASGVYIPAPLFYGNVLSVTPRRAMWTRNGCIVSVTGSAAYSVQSSGAVTIYLSLPIPSEIDGTEGLAGVLASESGDAGTVMGVSGSSVALLNHHTIVSGPDTLRYAYTYELR